MEGVILFNCNFVLPDVFKQLLKEWIVRVLKEVEKVLSYDSQKFLVALVDGSIVNNCLWSLDDLLDVFKGFRAVLARFAPLVLRVDVCVDLLRVDVVHTHARPIIPHNLTLEAKLAVAHRPNKTGLALSSGLLLFGKRNGGGLDGLRVDDLGWREILKDVVLNF